MGLLSEGTALCLQLLEREGSQRRRSSLPSALLFLEERRESCPLLSYSREEEKIERTRWSFALGRLLLESECSLARCCPLLETGGDNWSFFQRRREGVALCLPLLGRGGSLVLCFPLPESRGKK